MSTRLRACLLFLCYGRHMNKRIVSGPATKYVAEEFRAQKRRLNMSFQDLEKISGVGRTTVDRALQGETTLAFETFLLICRALDLDPTTLIREAESRMTS